MMQNFEKINNDIKERYISYKKENPDRMKARLKFAWSNWGFGMEDLETSLKRLKKNGIQYIELHGNHYGADLGYDPEKVLELLRKYEIKVSGICGMFSLYNDMSSSVAQYRQNAIDYIKRSLLFAEKVAAEYMLIVPAAVGRPEKYDDFEIDRSVDTIKKVADIFNKHGIKAAIEPIRSAEVSIVHTFDDAEQYIDIIDHKGVQNINGDLYHMLVEEDHIAERLYQAGSKLINLHLADTNRGALGKGMMDIDTIMMALYLIDYNNKNCFCTAEPLGQGGDPYPAMYGRPYEKELDNLVSDSIKTWNEREEAIRGLD